MSLTGRSILVAAAILVVTGAVLADRAAPDSCTVGVERARGSVTIPRPYGVDPARRRAWRMQLELDPDIRQPVPEWVLREGREAGAGYELAWDPASLSLLLHRGRDAPLLLGIARLPRPPREVVFARRGARLAILADGHEVVDALDPEGVPEPQAGPFPDCWSLAATGNLGASTLTVQDDGGLPTAWASDIPPGNTLLLEREAARGPLDAAERLRTGFGQRVLAGPGWTPPADPGRADHALLRLRQALLLRADRDPEAARISLGLAARAVAALGNGSPEHARLSLWLAWAEARNALASAGQDEAWAVAPAIDQLSVLISAQQPPEGPGMLLALIPDLAERAVRRPNGPRPLERVLGERASWLAVLDRSARAAAGILGDNLDAPFGLQLRFISHAAGALSGGNGSEAPGPLPTPADAPDWLAVRWRALAGADPGQMELPAPPASSIASAPLLPVIERLVQAAALQPLTAVRLRACLAEADEAAHAEIGAASGREASLARLKHARLRADRAAESAPVREAALARLVVALRNLADSQPGPERREAVALVKAQADRLGSIRPDTRSNSGSLVQRDPLAFALACLAASRVQQAEQDGLASNLRGNGGFVIPDLDLAFSGLAPFARLLIRRPDHPEDPVTTDLIWLHDNAVLPPAQALAAALAMQEATCASSRNAASPPLAGEPAPADWNLLRRLTSYTIPLDLLDPTPRPRARPGDGANLTP